MSKFINPGFYQRRHYQDLYDSIVEVSKKYGIEIHSLRRIEGRPHNKSFILSAFMHWVEINMDKFKTINFKEKDSWGNVESLYFLMSKVLSDHYTS